MERGAAVLVGGFDVGAIGKKFFCLGEASEDLLLFGVAGGLVELLDECGGVGDIERDGGRLQFVVGRVLSILGILLVYGRQQGET